MLASPHPPFREQALQNGKWPNRRVFKLYPFTPKPLG